LAKPENTSKQILQTVLNVIFSTSTAQTTKPEISLEEHFQPQVGQNRGEGEGYTGLHGADPQSRY